MVEVPCAEWISDLGGSRGTQLPFQEFKLVGNYYKD